MFINGQWYIEDATAALGENVDWMFYPAADEASYEERKKAIYEVLKQIKEYRGNGAEALGEHSYQGL